VLLLTTVTLAFALCGWRPSLGWWLLGGGQLLLAGLDIATLTGSAGEDVPLAARIVGACDALVAMRSPRPARGRGRRGGRGEP
jgi:hypothetical protein